MFSLACQHNACYVVYNFNMYSLSAAFDVGASLEVLKELFGNHGFLIGVKYSGARNPTYVSGKAIKTEMSSFFIKYVYIHRKKRLNQDFQD